MTGVIVGRLTVIERATNGSFGSARWLCRCECGKRLIVLGWRLRAGSSKSCGCLTREINSKVHRIHGESCCADNTKEYRAWVSIKQRCFDIRYKSYESYGGRGITMCEGWKNSFLQFLADVGRAPTIQHQIDRINNDGNYEPNNVRWTDRRTQCRNRRNTIYLELCGEKKSLCDWADELGLRRATIYARLLRKKIDWWIPLKSKAANVARSPTQAYPKQGPP